MTQELQTLTSSVDSLSPELKAVYLQTLWGWNSLDLNVPILKIAYKDWEGYKAWEFVLEKWRGEDKRIIPVWNIAQVVIMKERYKYSYFDNATNKNLLETLEYDQGWDIHLLDRWMYMKTMSLAEFKELKEAKYVNVNPVTWDKKNLLDWQVVVYMLIPNPDKESNEAEIVCKMYLKTTTYKGWKDYDFKNPRPSSLSDYFKKNKVWSARSSFTLLTIIDKEWTDTPAWGYWFPKFSKNTDITNLAPWLLKFIELNKLIEWIDRALLNIAKSKIPVEDASSPTKVQNFDSTLVIDDIMSI